MTAPTGDAMDLELSALGFEKTERGGNHQENSSSGVIGSENGRFMKRRDQSSGKEK